MKKLTGVFVIETGVVNRGDGLGNIKTAKKVTTHEGIKVFFSPASYKRALWSFLQKYKGWKVPFVTKEGVVQKIGTIIDSEEFDFTGTMIAKGINYHREGPFAIDDGISINNYFGDMEFMTNAGLSKLYGKDENNIINKEDFYGIYIMPFGVEINEVGVQKIDTVDTQINENDSIEDKIKKIYKALNLDKEINEELIKQWIGIVEDISYDPESKTTIIKLTKEERKRRLKDLLEGMGELAKRIEGSEKNLTPYFSAFSLDFMAPKYMLLIKDILRKKIREGGYLDKDELAIELKKFAQKEGKEIKTTDYINYKETVNEIIEKIFKES